MKHLAIVAAALAVPAVIAIAQTPPTTTPGTSPAAYIPLFGSGGGNQSGTSGTSGGQNSTWYIDTARNLIVLCSQNANGTNGTTATAPAFTCTAQAVQTTETGTSGAGTPSTGGAGSNPMGS